MTAQIGYVLYCTQVDTETNTCLQEAWLPAPALLPPMDAATGGILLGASYTILGMAWGIKHLTRVIRQ